MRLILVGLLLIATTFVDVQAQAATGHVVVNWTSPNYGYSISYRRNALSLIEASTANGNDYLVFASRDGELIVEASPPRTNDADCAQQMIDDVSDGAAMASSTDDGGTATVTFAEGENEITVRASCLTAPDASYQIAFTRSAPSGQFGQFEVAASAVVASFRPGAAVPQHSPTPDDMEYGIVEVTLIAVDPEVEPPPDSNLVNHPTRFFTVDILFHGLGDTNASVEQQRIIIPGIGAALEHVWKTSSAESVSDIITVESGGDVTGSFLFAVPQTQARAVFCYQHISNGDCTFLFEIQFPAGGQDLIAAGASPREPLELDPGH